MTELLLSLALAVALLMVFSVSLAKLHHAEQQFADRRTQARQLEATLLALQNGGDADKEITVERLQAPAPAGQAWVRASPPPDPRGKPVMSLVGLVPADKAPAGRMP